MFTVVIYFILLTISQAIGGDITKLATNEFNGLLDDLHRLRRVERSSSTTFNHHQPFHLGASIDLKLLSHRPKLCTRMEKSQEPMYFCPTPQTGNSVDWPCVRYSDLCNKTPDCPHFEDEHPTFCLFHMLLNQELNSIRSTVHSIFQRMFEIP
ncbi:hypothetical protein AB6A40_000155 [Gnathostoma spinigerum]|uniref:Uncharacterized protein n=1 Tax=Gnathostoma spinigerum TaxID=75299 RepID=A0ABD6E2S2_9BILA